VERTQRHAISVDDIEGTIREAVVTEHDCVPDHVVLLRPGGIPKTTSGKIQRRLTRQLWSGESWTCWPDPCCSTPKNSSSCSFRSR
jgi:acyl-CoA synthetase (AMP-forming)/AMP-acid ligase II